MFSFLLLASVIILLIDQPDLGQSILLTSSWIATVFVSGVSLIYIGIFLAIFLILFSSLLFFLPEKFGYIINRFLTFFNPNQGDGFQSSSKRTMKHFIWRCLTATWRCAPAPAAKNEAAVRQAGQKLLCFGAAPAFACGMACHVEEGAHCRLRAPGGAAKRGFINTTGRLLRSIINPSSPEIQSAAKRKWVFARFRRGDLRPPFRKPRNTCC